MIRKYGSEPFEVAVIHGGPGAFGSVACIAKELSKAIGTIEPIQSKYTIAELIAELREQITSSTKKPITLIGHSWGAWLIVLFAKNYPDMVKQLVLVGSGPFKKDYVNMIAERRFKNLSEEEGKLLIKSFEQLNDITFIEKDAALSVLGQLADKADNYNVIEIQEDTEESFDVDGKMFASIWPQADELRSSGELFNSLKGLKCPVVVIQGEFDTHPVEGVVEPLREQEITFETYILSKCGHSPFKEKYAKEQFYKILRDTIQRAPEA